MSGPDILREVEESMRAEKAAKFWKENGSIVIAMVVALIVGTAAQSLWSSHKHSQNEASTSLFLDAIEGKTAQADLAALSKEEKGTGSALAGLSGAAMLVEKKDWDGAIASYKNVIANKSVAQSYKDMALVQLVSLQLDHDDKATGAELLAALAPLVKDAKSPWNTKAIFTSALIKAQKNNDLKGAQVDLNTLAAIENLPPSFQAQVKALNEVYNIKIGSK